MGVRDPSCVDRSDGFYGGLCGAAHALRVRDVARHRRQRVFRQQPREPAQPILVVTATTWSFCEASLYASAKPRPDAAPVMTTAFGLSPLRLRALARRRRLTKIHATSGSRAVSMMNTEVVACSGAPGSSSASRAGDFHGHIVCNFCGFAVAF